MKQSLLAILLVCLAAVTIALLTGCNSLQGKAVGISGGVGALKVETSGSSSTGTLLPNILVGGGCSSIATAPAVKNKEGTQVVITYGEVRSFFGELFGLNAGITTFSYIGTVNESAAETTQRLNAFNGVVKSPPQPEPKAKDATAPETKPKQE